MKTGCVILAGGESSRMGKDKATLTIHGKSFIEHISETLDFFEEKYIARADKEKVQIPFWIEIEDVYKNKGPIGGLHAALCKCQSEALFVISCDCPKIKASLVRRLCAHMEEEYDAVVAIDQSKKIHPLCGVYRKKCASIFESQILKNNNKLMLALNKMNVKYVQVDSTQLFNVNTKMEYEFLIK